MTRISFSGVLLAGTIALASGCADAGAVGNWVGTVDTLANGTVLVSNPAGGVWEAGEAWRFEEDLRIGSADVEGPDLFGEIAALAVDDFGRIYVADRQAMEIRVFDAEGSYVRTIGRKGGGPGEIAAISGIGWGPGGDLWVLDHANSRFSVFDTTGAYRTSHRRPGGFVMIPWRGGFDVEGRLYDINGVPSTDGMKRIIIRHDSEMSPRDTFMIPAFEAASFTLNSPDGRRRMAINIPFAPSQSWLIADDGHVWIGTTDQYRIHRLAFSGDTTMTVQREHRPVAVTKADRDRVLQEYETFIGQGGDVDPSMIPSHKPAFGRFFLDDLGYLWVAPARDLEAEPGYDVFDPEGRYLGFVRTGDDLGGRLQDPLVKGDVVYAVVLDEFEVPHVVRGRLVGRDDAG